MRLPWGTCDFTAIENGLQFKVNGFKHKGFVRILYIESNDDFTVELLSDNEVIKTIENLYIDNLLEVVDYEIERVDNYDNAVQGWLNSNED